MSDAPKRKPAKIRARKPKRDDLDTPAGKPRRVTTDATKPKMPAPKWQTCDTCGKRVNVNDGTDGTHTCFVPPEADTGTEWDVWEDRPYRLFTLPDGTQRIADDSPSNDDRALMEAFLGPRSTLAALTEEALMDGSAAHDGPAKPWTFRRATSTLLLKAAFALIKIAQRIGPLFALAVMVGCGSPVEPWVPVCTEWATHTLADSATNATVGLDVCVAYAP